jgi:O-antigen/teichoic acid export membrane protein
MVSGKKIATNMGMMVASQLTTWSIAFLLAIFLPRYLGATGIGELSIANSIWMIVSVLITFGMDMHITKTVARHPEKTAEVLGTSLVIRFTFFILSCILVSLYLFFVRYSPRIIEITAIVGLSYLFGTVSGALSSVLIGLERMGLTSISSVINRVLTTTISLLMIFLGYGVYAIAAVSSIVLPFNILFTGYFILQQYKKIPLRFSMKEAKAMLHLSAPYLVTGMTLTAYQQIDTLFIASLVDTKTVGWYNTAVGLFSTLMFLPVAFGTVIFPALSRSYVAAQEKLLLIARRSIDLMFLFSIPIGMGIMVIAKPLILLLYGPDFIASSAILATLGIVLIFTYLNTLLGQLLISTDRTGKWNIVMIGATLLTIPLDLVLIPWTRDALQNGALGGALSFLITECCMVIGAVFLLPKGTLQWSNVRTATLSLISGLLMVSTSWWFRDNLMVVSIIVGALTYSVSVLLLRIIPHDDMLLLKGMIMNIINQLRRKKGADSHG